MGKQIVIEDKKVTISRVLWKERKSLIESIGGKIDSIADSILGQGVAGQESAIDVETEASEEETQGTLEKIVNIIGENTDEIEVLLLKYTNLTNNDLAEWDIYQVALLVDELIKYNGLNIKKCVDFFTKALNMSKTAQKQIKALVHEIPS